MRSGIIHILLLFLLLALSSSVCLAEVAGTVGENVAQKTTAGSIVFAGMVVVFVSLVLIALVIDLLKHLQKKDKKQPKSENEPGYTKKIVSISPIQQKISESPLDQKIETAVVMTIFLHENEVENHSKMLLTMKRAKISQWQQSSKLEMPNANFGNVPIIQKSTSVVKDKI